MGLNQIEGLNQRRLKQLEEVKIFLKNLNNISQNRVFTFDIDESKLVLRGLIDKLQRDSINISILSEVSSGKSTFLNALIFGEPVLESKIGETTAKIFNIRYDEKFSIDGKEQKNLSELKEQIAIENAYNLKYIHKKRDIRRLQSIITLPNENLKKGIELYDTPGFATINEESIMILLKETISKSDATILLLDISQGIKKSEHHFIQDMLSRISHNKRFIVLNKYDMLIDEDTLLLKSKEEIKSEIENLINNIESKLQELQGDTKEKIESFHLSAKKALIAKITKDSKKLEESRFELFEDKFWTRIIEAKDELFKDNTITFYNLKKEIKESLTKEKERVFKERKSLQIELRESLENRDKILNLESNISKLEKLNASSINQKSIERIAHLEDKLLSDILNMLHINLESELSAISLKNRLFFWNLKDKYKESIIGVIEDARSFILKQINFFITEVMKEERKKDTIILEINRDLNMLFSLEKYEKRVNLDERINRVMERIDGYVDWNFFTLMGLMRYNLSSKKEERLTPSFIELKSEISTIKRDLISIIINSRVELYEYIKFTSKKLQKIKSSISNQDSLELEIENLSIFIEDIERFTNI